MPKREWRIGRLKGECVLVFWRDGRRQRRRLGTTDARAAELAAPAVYAELTRPKGTTVAALWKGYGDAYAGRAVVGTMEHTWKALRERFGHLRGDAITTADCEAHTEARRKAGIKDGTIHTELGHLRMVLLWAAKQNPPPIAKAPHIERPAKPKPREKHLTAPQVRALVDSCAMPHLRAFVHLAYATAGRAGAILDLTWDRVDFERGKIDLENPDIDMPHKGRAIVPMTDTLRATLLGIRAGALSPYVIEWGGQQVGSVKKGLAAAATRAGLPKVTPHMLRHSAAVRMAEGGVPMEEIASYLGHGDVKVTRRIYARFSPDHLRGAAKALELSDTGSMNQRALRKV